MTSQVDADIRSSLLNISRLVREVGDREISRVIEEIIQCPDQIVALHDAFRRKLKRRSRKSDSELALKERENWFLNFSSTKGEKLKSTTANALARLTRNWDLSTEQIKNLLVCSVLWAKSPGLFWTGGPSDENITRRCYNDLNAIDELSPLRRRILLVTISQQVQQTQKAQPNTEPTGRKRSRGTTDWHRRDQECLHNAMCSLTQQLWPDLTAEKQQKIQDKITRYSLAGWKWRQLKAKEMILAFQNINVTQFERRPWPLVEIEAINGFVQTLPQVRIQSTLRKAFNAITDYYLKSSDGSSGQEAGSQLRAPSIESHMLPLVTSRTSPAADINILSDNNEPSFDDAQATEVLSSITRNSQGCQSPRGLVKSHQLLLAESPNNPTPTNWETSPPHPTDDASQELLTSSIPVGGDATFSQHSPTFVQTASELEHLPRGEHFILEIPNPLPSWQSKSRQDHLDWGSSFSLEIYNDIFPESISNPLPPTGDTPSLDLVDWDNYMLGDFGTLVLPLYHGRMPSPVEN